MLLCHPWESGCDNSPRWDDLVDRPWSVDAWHTAKGDLLATIERSASGAPLTNPAFEVGSVGFSALVAWNALELAAVTGDDELASDACELADAVDSRWDPDLLTWVDDGPTARGSGRVRTHDALLPLLVVDRPEARAQLTDPAAFGAPFGPTGVHRDEPTFDPTGYWRGGSWPQLTYLSWRAARWAGDGDDRGVLPELPGLGRREIGLRRALGAGLGIAARGGPPVVVDLGLRRRVVLTRGTGVVVVDLGQPGAAPGQRPAPRRTCPRARCRSPKDSTCPVASIGTTAPSQREPVGVGLDGGTARRGRQSVPTSASASARTGMPLLSTSAHQVQDDAEARHRDAGDVPVGAREHREQGESRGPGEDRGAVGHLQRGDDQGRAQAEQPEVVRVRARSVAPGPVPHSAGDHPGGDDEHQQDHTLTVSRSAVVRRPLK